MWNELTMDLSLLLSIRCTINDTLHLDKLKLNVSHTGQWLVVLHCLLVHHLHLTELVEYQLLAPLDEWSVSD